MYHGNGPQYLHCFTPRYQCYPNIQLDLPPHIHDHSPSTAFTPAVPHDYDNTSHFPSLLANSTDTPSFSAHARLHVDESLVDALPLNNNVSVLVSLDPIDQVPTESCCVSTSPNPGPTRATHGNMDSSTRTTHLSTPEPSVFTFALKSNSNASPPDSFAVECTADTCAPSEGSDTQLSASANLILGDILISGSLLSSDSPVTGSDCASTTTKYYSSMLARAAPFASPPLVICWPGP